MTSAANESEGRVGGMPTPVAADEHATLAPGSSPGSPSERAAAGSDSSSAASSHGSEGVDFPQKANRAGDATNAPAHDTEVGASMPDKLTPTMLPQGYRWASGGGSPIGECNGRHIAPEDKRGTLCGRYGPATLPEPKVGARICKTCARIAGIQPGPPPAEDVAS